MDFKDYIYIDGKWFLLCTFIFLMGKLVFANSSSTNNRKTYYNPLECFNKTEIQKISFENTLLVFSEKWPRIFRGCPIFIQKDNHKPLLKDGDSILLKEGIRYGWKIQLKSQFPNSPDFNITDVVVFNTI